MTDEAVEFSAVVCVCGRGFALPELAAEPSEDVPNLILRCAGTIDGLRRVSDQRVAALRRFLRSHSRSAGIGHAVIVASVAWEDGWL